MKKLFLTAITMSVFVLASNAQEEKAAAAPAQEKMMSKEEKAKMKIKQEEEMNEALKQAELTDDQIKQAKEILAEAKAKSSELKKSDGLSEADKAAKKEEINTEKNNRLKEIMGADKYKVFTAARKKQKEAWERTKSAE